MNIFVTGGTGLLGGHFINCAIRKGHSVTAVRRAGSLARVRICGEVKWLDKELENLTSHDFKNTQALLHFAATGVKHRDANWSSCFQTNLTGTLAVCHAAIDAGVRRIIHCGSCFEYGSSATRYDAVPPWAPLEPTGPYHASKAAATMAVLGLAAERHVGAAVLRPFHIYGVGEHEERFWPSLRRAAAAGTDFPMTLGEQIRDFLPAELAASTFLNVCTNRQLAPGKPEVHNVGSGRPQTLFEFAQYWWHHWKAKGRLLHGKIPYRPGEVMRYVPLLTLQPNDKCLPDCPTQ